MSVEDATQLAMCGLLKAIDKFDMSLGTRFSTYACYWIRSEITYHTKLVGYSKLDKHSTSLCEHVGDGDIMLEEIVSGLVAKDYDCHASDFGLDEWAVSGICDIVFSCLDSLTSIRAKSRSIVRQVLMELRDPSVQIMEAYRRVAQNFGVTEREVRHLSNKVCRELRNRLLMQFGNEAEVSEIGRNVQRRRIVNSRTLTTRVDWDRFSFRSSPKRRKLTSFYKDKHRNDYILGIVASERSKLRNPMWQESSCDDLAGSGADVAIAREVQRERLDEVEDQWASLEAG